MSRFAAILLLSPPSYILYTLVMKESVALVILGETFDANITFKKHIGSVFRVASQRLAFLWTSWRVFHDQSIIGETISWFCGDCFGTLF